MITNIIFEKFKCRVCQRQLNYIKIQTNTRHTYFKTPNTVRIYYYQEKRYLQRNSFWNCYLSNIY